MNPPPPLPPFRVTNRDERMMQAIVRFRLLAPPQLLQIVGGSPRGIRNRLRLLTVHNYLVRLQSKLTEPLAYGIANKGARFLAGRSYTINTRIDWSAENQRTDYFRTHTLAVADTMLLFERAATTHGVELLDHHQMLPDMPEHTQRTERPFTSHVRISHENRTIAIAVQPDRLFSLLYPDERHNFALEQDLGTMDIWPNRIVGKSSLRRKLLAYFHGRVQKRFAHRWGFKSFRILIVTSSETRIEHMLRAQERIAPHCPPGFFMYSTTYRLAYHGALGPAWTTSKRDNVSLLPAEHASDRKIVSATFRA
jgi:hypothetical protein